MANKITKWNCMKVFLCIFDFSLLLLNLFLLLTISFIIYNEYYSRGSLKLFFIPFLVSLVNAVLDVIMNKINIRMKYAGHNRYGMMIRFFMVYFIIIIIIYVDQNSKYILIDKIRNNQQFIVFIGFVDLGLLFFTMILSFFVVDVQSFKQIFVKKNNKHQSIATIESINEIQRLEMPEYDSY